MKLRTVLSLFDGISCGRLALDKAGIEYDKYYASEIDKHAIKVATHNYPDTVELGDINKWREWPVDWSRADLILAGSPCQGFSMLGKQLNFEDARSKLFFVFVDILNHVKAVNPKVKFLLENVIMNRTCENIISELLDVQPVKINSRLLVPQNRPRIYWANWFFSKPDQTAGSLSSILESGMPVDSILTEGRKKWVLNNPHKVGKYLAIDPVVSMCLTARGDAGWNCTYVTRNGEITRLTPLEWEKLQGVPENYTDCVENKHRYHALGNGWTVDVIAHIFSFLPRNEQAIKQLRLDYA
jgi:site-specific DNA-cytosine methylase